MTTETDTPTPRLLDLDGIAQLELELVAARGLPVALQLGGAIGALLARPRDGGGRAWTMAAAGEHHGLELPEALAAYALHHGALEAWSLHAADLHLAELDPPAGQTRLEVMGGDRQ